MPMPPFLLRRGRSGRLANAKAERKQQISETDDDEQAAALKLTSDSNHTGSGHNPKKKLVSLLGFEKSSSRKGGMAKASSPRGDVETTRGSCFSGTESSTSENLVGMGPPPPDTEINNNDDDDEDGNRGMTTTSSDADEKSIFSELTEDASLCSRTASATAGTKGTQEMVVTDFALANNTNNRARNPVMPEEASITFDDNQSVQSVASDNMAMVAARAAPATAAGTAAAGRRGQLAQNRGMSTSCLMGSSSHHSKKKSSRHLNSSSNNYGYNQQSTSIQQMSASYKQFSTRSLLGLCGDGTQGRRFSMGHNSVGSLGSYIPGDEDDDGGGGGGGANGANGNASGEPEQPHFEMIMAIVGSWESVKSITGFQEILAEQMILRMMELDSNVRHDLGLPSIRSPQFNVVCEKIVSAVDALLSFLGPEGLDYGSDDEDDDHNFHSNNNIARVGDQYRADGFKEYLLAPSLVDALKFVLPPEDFTSEIQHGWTTVLNYLVSKMSRPQ